MADFVAKLSRREGMEHPFFRDNHGEIGQPTDRSSAGWKAIPLGGPGMTYSSQLFCRRDTGPTVK
jgi:hypothetical protein